MPTTRYHTPLSNGDGLSHTVLNAIFSSIDAGLPDETITITAGETLSENDVVYLDESSGTWFRADNDATGGIKVGRYHAVVTESGGISSSGTGTALLHGAITTSGLTAGEPIYLGSTAGGWTQTRPTVSDGGAQVAIVKLGYALSTTLFFLTRLHRIDFVKRATLADDATLTIEHLSDPSARTRKVFAYVTGMNYDEPLMINSYTSGAVEMGARFDDGAGANGDTQTTFRNQTGVSADITCIVRF